MPAKRKAARKALRTARKRPPNGGGRPALARGEKPGLPARAVIELTKSLAAVYRLVDVDAETVIEEAQARGLGVESLGDLRKIEIEKRDALATTFIKTAKIWATGHGASLGTAGVMTMAADVAALVAVNLRLVQHVCLSYGLPTTTERVDAWGLLLAALGEKVDVAALREASAVSESDHSATRELVAAVAGAFAKRLLGGRGAGRAVPLVGAVFGGLSNYAFTVEVGTRAREFYRNLAS